MASIDYKKLESLLSKAKDLKTPYNPASTSTKNTSQSTNSQTTKKSDCGCRRVKK